MKQHNCVGEKKRNVNACESESNVYVFECFPSFLLLWHTALCAIWPYITCLFMSIL